jgi:acyl transferase domain-containing protein/NADPH:quinone reductase-like Zn-dependent oxidoreductase
VNSFGFGGTNAHVILEAYRNGSSRDEAYLNDDTSVIAFNLLDASEHQHHLDANGSNGTLINEPASTSPESIQALDQPHSSEGAWLLVVSARSKESLKRTLALLSQWINRHWGDPLAAAALSHTLISRRSTHRWRTSLVATALDQTTASLHATRVERVLSKPTPIFIFTGQGAQYARMGRELQDFGTAFTDSLLRSESILQDLLGAPWSLVGELAVPEAKSRINESRISQPATTAVQIALVDLLDELGVRPTAVLGHSSGEVAAAYAAGLLSHQDALVVSYHKGFVAEWAQEALGKTKGAMLAVGLSEQDVTKYLEMVARGTASVACVNSPSSVTISGDESAVADLKLLLDQDSVFARRLKVDIAYHSHHMAAVSQKFEQSISSVSNKPRNLRSRFFSSVSGREVKGPLDRSYWVENLVSKVRFSDGLEALVNDFSLEGGDVTFVEIGPHGALEGPIKQTLSASRNASKWTYTPSLLRKRNAREAALAMAGSLWQTGLTLDFSAPLFLDHGNLQALKPLQTLPAYSWDHLKSHWHESRLSTEYRFRKQPPHDLLGLLLPGTTPIEPIFRHILTVDELPWLREHIIDGFALYPGSAFLVHAIEGVKQIVQRGEERRWIKQYLFKNVYFTKSIVIPDSGAAVEILLSLTPAVGASERLATVWHEFRLISRQATEESWASNCHGLIGYQFDETQHEETICAKDYIERIRTDKACSEQIRTSEFYEQLRRNGVDYGDSFSIIDTLGLGDHTAVGTIRVPDIRKRMPSRYMQPHVIHPATFDAFMHVALPVYHRHCSGGPVMLTSISEATVSASILNQPGDQFTVVCSLKQAYLKSGAVDARILQRKTGSSDQLVEVATLTNEEFRSIGNGPAMDSQAAADNTCDDVKAVSCSMGWKPVTTDFPPSFADSLEHQVELVAAIDAVSLASTAATTLLELSQRMKAPVISWETISEETSKSRPTQVIVDADMATPKSLGNVEIIVRQCKGVLWVSTSSSPATELSTSIARVSQIAQNNGVYFSRLVVRDIHDPVLLQRLILQVLYLRSEGPSHTQAVESVYWYRNGELLVPRLQAHESSNQWLQASSRPDDYIHLGAGQEHALYHGANTQKLEFKTPGLLSSACFVPHSWGRDEQLSDEQIEVKVFAHAVNRIDATVAMGRAAPSQCMAGEFAGVVLRAGHSAEQRFKPGDRICGLRAVPDYGNIVRVSHLNVMPLATHTPFEEAAAVPLACLTAYQALSVIGRIDTASKVLIHGASGGIGQVAGILARQLGAQVFCTVSSEEKARVVTEVLGLPRTQVLSNRSTAFQRDIQQYTGGVGVDLVLNCSAADLIEPSFACLAEGGVLVNLVKSNKISVPVSTDRSTSYVTLNMSTLLEKNARRLQRDFQEAWHLYNSSNQKIQVTTLPISELEKAFRQLMSQKMTGKIVLSCAEESQVLKPASALRKSSLLEASGTYVLVGGATGLHKSCCAFLAARGAARIISVDLDGSKAQAKSDHGNAHVVNVTARGCLNQVLEEELADRLPFTVIDFQPPPHIADYQNIQEQNGLVDADVSNPNATESPVPVLQEVLSCVSPRLIIHVSEHEAIDESVNALSLPLSEALDWEAIEGGEISLRVPLLDSSQGSTQLCQLLEYVLATTARLPQELFLLPRTEVVRSSSTVLRDLSNEIANTSDDSAAVNDLTIESRLKMAQNFVEAQELVSAEICQQLARFCAVDAEDIRQDSSILDIGLDSLLAIEFKNWLGRTLHAPMQTTEILDASSLKKLISLVCQRSLLLNHVNSTPTQDHADRADAAQSNERLDDARGLGHTNGHTVTVPDKAQSVQQLPPLPLPELESLVERHLIGVRPFATDEEFENTLRLANDFKAPEGLGTTLYKALLALKTSNPDGWYSQIYGNSQYFGRKRGLAPYALFYFTHPVMHDLPRRHTQAERASLITSVLIDYKQRLEADMIEPQYLNEQPQCMALYKNLFNACREPRVGLDVLNVHPGHDFFLVLRRGHVHKVSIADVMQSAPTGRAQDVRTALQALFEEILHETEPCSTDWLGILSGQHRTSWAQDYDEFIEHSHENAAYIQAIQTSAFIICLDDGAPETPEQRARQLHFGDGSNRWFDKSVQYVVFANGISGSLADHTGLDAPTVQAVNMEIAAAIREDQATINGTNGTNGHGLSAIAARRAIPLAKISHARFPNLENSIARVRESYDSIISRRRHFFTTLSFGSSLMRAHKIPPASGIQLIVQLAARYFFDYSPACWETVLQTSFRHGRVEINQVVSMEALEWIRAMLDADSDDIAAAAVAAVSASPAAAANGTAPHSFTTAAGTDLSALKHAYIIAARRHTSNVLAVTRSGGSDRYLALLQEMSKLPASATPNPALYLDPVYQRSRPRKLMSSNFSTGMAENGCVQADEDSVWSHFEFGAERYVSFLFYIVLCAGWNSAGLHVGFRFFRWFLSRHTLADNILQCQILRIG